MPIFCFFILLLLATQANCSESGPLTFADGLAAKGDHYRAITAHKRFFYIINQSLQKLREPNWRPATACWLASDFRALLSITVGTASNWIATCFRWITIRR